MKALIDKYRNFSFEERTLFTTKFSIALHALLALGKFIIAGFYGVFFFVAGCVNVFLMLAKLECYLGVKSEKRSFETRNKLIAGFLLAASLVYIVYMARFVLWDARPINYSEFLGINIAFISFIELGFAIKGLFNSFGKGHYYRNIKIINFASGLTAIVLTEVAIMSFASQNDTRLISGWSGIGAGIVILLLAIFIYYAPRTSIIDREHNVYQKVEADKLNLPIVDNRLSLTMVKGYWYGSYIYEAIYANDIIDGHIYKTKTKLWSLPLWLKIILIIFSEILIFVYAFGAIIFYFRSIFVIEKLDALMKANGFEKITTGIGN